MSAWNSTTLAYVDHEYDRSNSSRGGSRFGSYISAREAELDAEDRTDRAEFTAWAWRVATPPVMSPGYVQLRPDLSKLTFTRDEDGDQVVEAVVPLPHRALDREHRPPYEVGDWEAPYGRGETYRQMWAPSFVKRPAVLASATLLVPARDWDLFVPSGGAAQLVDDAQLAVQTAARLINEYVGPQIANLLGDKD